MARLPPLIVHVIWAAALNNIDVLLLRPLRISSACPEGKNGAFRIPYKQYILLTVSKIKRDFLEDNFCIRESSNSISFWVMA
jgi:hypothetical protein